MESILNKVPRVYQVCKCYDLRAGNKTITYILLVIFFLAIVGVWVDIIQTEAKVEYALDEVKTLLGDPTAETKIAQAESELNMVIDLYGVAFTILAGILMIFMYSFIKGINQQQTMYMVPHMVIFGMHAAFDVLFTIVLVLFIPFNFDCFATLALLILIFIIKTVIFSYIFICAFSLYREIEDENTKRLESHNVAEYTA